MARGQVRVLGPLRHRDFRLLAIGSLTSQAGDGLFRAAIAVQVLSVQNDPRALGLVAAAWAGGQVVLLPLGGWASDRFEHRRVMIAADLWRSLMIGLIGVLSISGALQLWHLLALGAGFGAGNAFFNPASVALVPDLLPDDELPQANAFLGVARPTMLYIVGPLLGGVVVTLGGPGLAFLLDAATFPVSALMLWRIRPVSRASAARARAVTRQGLGAGFSYVRRTRWAWCWLLAAAVSTLAWHGPFDVLVPVIFLNELGMTEAETARAIALVLAAGGLGSIVAATWLAQRDLPRRFVTTLYAVEALGVLVATGYGAMTAVWQAMLIGLWIHSLFAVSEIIWATMLQRFVPREVLGRVASLDWMTAMSVVPVSFLLAGVLGHTFGPRATLVGAGLVGSTAVLLLLFVPGAREPERTAGAPVPSEGLLPREDGVRGAFADSVPPISSQPDPARDSAPDPGPGPGPGPGPDPDHGPGHGHGPDLGRDDRPPRSVPRRPA